MLVKQAVESHYVVYLLVVDALRPTDKKLKLSKPSVFSGLRLCMKLQASELKLCLLFRLYANQTKPPLRLSLGTAGIISFVQAFLRSVERFFQERPDEVGSAVFDKDDDLAVDFVTAASNLRALCYDIPAQSAFEAKVHILHSLWTILMHG